MADLPELGVMQLQRAVAAGEIQPADAVERSLRRAEELSRLNAFVELRQEAPAEAVEAGGHLSGVPVAVKDMFVDRGRKPTVGSNVGGYWLDGTAAVIERLRSAGAAVIGYTNMHEWAIGTTSVVTATGPVRNPLDHERIAGGSSGGSAAAVAARIVPAAVGTDAGGSIRIPAACCGVVGLKPTWGLVPMAGFVEEGSPIDHIGPIARSVADVRVLLEVLSGQAIGIVDVEGLRLGVARPHFFDNLDGEVAGAVAGAIEVLAELVEDVLEVEVAGANEAAQGVAGTLLPLTAELVADDLRARPEAFQPATLSVLMLGAAMSEQDREQAADVARRVADGWARAFEEVDVIVTPTIPTPPPSIDEPVVSLPLGPSSVDVAQLELNAPMNLAGVPALALPCRETDMGLSVSITLSAARGNDAAVLALGEAFEQARPSA